MNLNLKKFLEKSNISTYDCGHFEFIPLVTVHVVVCVAAHLGD